MDRIEPGTQTPSIAVIIPAYNQARYIEEAVRSVLKQTYPDFELVVVDDGSTDETPQVLAGIHDPRLRVVRQQNGGLSAARNTGIRESTAPLITLLDSDDYFFPDKLEVLSAYLDEHPEIGMITGNAQIIDQDGGVLLCCFKPGSSLELPDLLAGNPIIVGAVMFRREWYDRVGVFDETLRACEDWDMWLRMAYAGCRFAWIDRTIMAYRYHPSQMTRESERMRKAILTVLDKFFCQPGLPEHLLAYRDRAYAAGLINAAAYAYYAMEYDKGQRDLAEAMQLDPALAEGSYRGLLVLLNGWSNDPRSANPVEFLVRVADNPPPGHPALRRELLRAVADKILGALFASPPDYRREQRQALLTVIRYKPAWLLNRGVMRMIADAWLPGIPKLKTKDGQDNNQ